MRKRCGMMLALMWGLVAAVHGQWHVASQSKAAPLGHGAWEVTKNLEGPSEAELKLVIFDSSRCTLRVVDQGSRRGRLSLAEAMRQTGALAGTNGGYFTPEFEPLGLQIASEKRTGSLSKASLLTGMIVVRKKKPYMLWRDEYRNLPGITDTIQAGPRLVNGGARVSGLNDTKSRPRTFLATDNHGHLALGICRSVTLAELGEILASARVIKELDVERALNLDGGSSTGLWWCDSRGADHYDREAATVRNFLAIVVRE